MSAKKCFEWEEREREKFDFIFLQGTTSSDVIIARISLTFEFLVGLVVNLLFFHQGTEFKQFPCLAHKRTTESQQFDVVRSVQHMPDVVSK